MMAIVAISVRIQVIMDNWITDCKYWEQLIDIIKKHLWDLPWTTVSMSFPLDTCHCEIYHEQQCLWISPLTPATVRFTMNNSVYEFPPWHLPLWDLPLTTVSMSFPLDTCHCEIYHEQQCLWVSPLTPATVRSTMNNSVYEFSPWHLPLWDLPWTTVSMSFPLDTCHCEIYHEQQCLWVSPLTPATVRSTMNNSVYEFSPWHLPLWDLPWTTVSMIFPLDTCHREIYHEQQCLWVSPLTPATVRSTMNNSVYEFSPWHLPLWDLPWTTVSMSFPPWHLPPWDLPWTTVSMIFPLDTRHCEIYHEQQCLWVSPLTPATVRFTINNSVYEFPPWHLPLWDLPWTTVSMSFPLDTCHCEIYHEQQCLWVSPLTPATVRSTMNNSVYEFPPWHLPPWDLPWTTVSMSFPLDTLHCEIYHEQQCLWVSPLTPATVRFTINNSVYEFPPWHLPPWDLPWTTVSMSFPLDTCHCEIYHEQQCLWVSPLTPATVRSTMNNSVYEFSPWHLPLWDLPWTTVSMSFPLDTRHCEIYHEQQCLWVSPLTPATVRSTMNNSVYEFPPWHPPLWDLPWTTVSMSFPLDTCHCEIYH